MDLIGTIQNGDKLSGELSDSEHLEGVLSGFTALVGELSSGERLHGFLADSGTLEGVLSLPEIVTDAEVYDGDYVITPKMVEQRLDTFGKVMRDDVLVLDIPVYETTNASGGTTIYIAMGD